MIQNVLLSALSQAIVVRVTGSVRSRFFLKKMWQRTKKCHEEGRFDSSGWLAPLTGTIELLLYNDNANLYSNHHEDEHCGMHINSMLFDIISDDVIFGEVGLWCKRGAQIVALNEKNKNSIFEFSEDI